VAVEFAEVEGLTGCPLLLTGLFPLPHARPRTRARGASTPAIGRIAGFIAFSSLLFFTVQGPVWFGFGSD
jgi:hypothetical protein